MQDDPFPVAERILTDIEACFQKDPELDEFDIVPVTESQNRSPVLHVGHSLGLEVWCVQSVFSYAYHWLIDLRQRKKREEPRKVLRLLRGILLLDPDVQTFWNVRKELVCFGRLEPEVDLQLTKLVLTRKPKCAEAFSHRRWILKKLVSKVANVGPVDNALLKEEIKVCTRAANQQPNNYHAWNHRIWTVQHVVPLCKDPMTEIVSEHTVSEEWMTFHVSDFSGMQYREFLLDKIVLHQSSQAVSLPSFLKSMKPLQELYRSVCENGGDVIDITLDGLEEAPLCGLYVSELLTNTDLIYRYPGHESLWCHRRHSLTRLKEMSENVSTIVDVVWHLVQRFEEQLLTKCIASGGVQCRLAERHRQWILHALGINQKKNS